MACHHSIIAGLLFTMALLSATGALAARSLAQQGSTSLPTHKQLTAALKAILGSHDGANAGYSAHMWAVVVDADGIIKMVTKSGDDRHDQPAGSRIAAAAKAHTSYAFSTTTSATSTANLYGMAQPGGQLYGVQHNFPMDAAAMYSTSGNPLKFGNINDPFVGKHLGGLNVFGGGLALYDSKGKFMGGLGVSGDTACTDHIVAWKLREKLGLDYVPAGAGGPIAMDNMMHGKGTDTASHPECDAMEPAMIAALPTMHPTKKVAAP